MIRKQTGVEGKVRVTFTAPPVGEVTGMWLAGEFNGWSPAPMQRGSDGAWTITLPLESARSYQFRYRDDQGRWHNDADADAYVPNEYGSENSVVDLSVVKPPAARLTGGRSSRGARSSSVSGHRSASAGRPSGGRHPHDRGGPGKPPRRRKGR